MMLSALVDQYLSYKQNMGMRFHTEARTLRSFCRMMGDIAITDIAAERVRAFLAGSGPLTSFWHRKYEVLSAFYRFALARGYAACSPPSHLDSATTAVYPLHLFACRTATTA